jgi:IclR family transcriptional regulator, KDG regulon repressor
MARSASQNPVEPEPEARSTAVQSVGMAFAVLQQLASDPAPVGQSELARRLGETKARVHRHLATLRELGLVQKDPNTDGYRLGWKSYRLGMSLVENFGLRKLAHRHLLRLHHDSGQTVALAMGAGPELTVIDAIQSTGDIAITIRAGSTITGVSSALGRAVLAFQPEPVRQAALAAQPKAISAKTPHDPRRLSRALDTVRQRWYEIATGERLPGVAALAAPVFDDRNEAVGAVALIGSASVITEPVPRPMLQALHEAARRISEELGATVWQQTPFKTETSR